MDVKPMTCLAQTKKNQLNGANMNFCRKVISVNLAVKFSCLSFVLFSLSPEPLVWWR